MPKLTAPSASSITKMILMGDSGTGKTGALASLVAAGYQLRILDYDNKVDGGFLQQELMRQKLDLGMVEYEPLRDKYKSTSKGPVLDGAPQAFIRGVQLIDKWSDGSTPSAWGPKHILVVDSLTFLADAAFNLAEYEAPTSKDPRQWYGAAQDKVSVLLSYITGASFATNVIVTAHVAWTQRQDQTFKGYPKSVGQAQGPLIPAYFDTVALTESIGAGEKVKRTIRTTPTAMIDLKNPASAKMLPQLDLATGLAEFFKTLRT